MRRNPVFEAMLEEVGIAGDAFWRAHAETKHLPLEEAARERRRLCDLYEAQMRAEKGRAA
jgi:hypothetical protein